MQRERHDLNSRGTQPDVTWAGQPSMPPESRDSCPGQAQKSNSVTRWFSTLHLGIDGDNIDGGSIATRHSPILLEDHQNLGSVE